MMLRWLIPKQVILKSLLPPSSVRVCFHLPPQLVSDLSQPPLPLHHNPSVNQVQQIRSLSTSRSLLAEQKSLMARFKQMLKDYWYIIIPVEIGTSIIWYAGIFLSLKSGVDLVNILSSIGVSEENLAKLPAAGGDAGYHALAFVCYKIISPIRHGLSLGISAAVVSGLEKTRPGYLRTSSSIAQEARETKDDLKEKYDEKMAEGREKIDELKCRADEKRTEARKQIEERMEEWRTRK